MTEVNVTDANKALAKFIKSEHGVGVKPETVALILRAQREFRDSPERRAEIEARHAEAVAKQEERVLAAKARYEKQLAKLDKARPAVEPADDGFVEGLFEDSLDVVTSPKAAPKPKVARKPKKAVERFTEPAVDAPADEVVDAEVIEEDEPKTVVLDATPDAPDAEESEDDWDFDVPSTTPADEEDF